LAGFAVVLSFPAQLLSQSDDLQTQRMEVVKIRVVREGKPDETAAGLYVGRDLNNAYFITANHAAGPGSEPIKALKIQFYNNVQEFEAAFALNDYSTDLDLAVIQSSSMHLPSNIPSIKNKDPQADTLVHIIGHPPKGPWSVWPGNIQNENASGNVRRFLTNRDFSLTGGYSGGPVFDSQGFFLGMHLETDAFFGICSKSSDILRQLSAWKVPVNNVQGAISAGVQAARSTATEVAAPARKQSQGASDMVPPPPQQAKVINDPAEYNSYVDAIQQWNKQDPNATISKTEAFLTQYPNSVMKEEALELLMSAYGQTNNQAKVFDTAQRILEVNPNNLRALVMQAFTKRSQAEAGQNPQENLADSVQYSTRGLEALKTAPKFYGMSDADFQKFKTQASAVFNAVVGISALQNKDYERAQTYLRDSVQANPDDLHNVYPLAVAYLTAGPTEKDVDGLFFIARAANLAQGNTKDQIATYGRSKYIRYHGSEDGWNGLLTMTATTALPPVGFTISH